METANNTEFSKKFLCPIYEMGSSRYYFEIFIQVVLGLVVGVSFSLILFLSIPIYLFRFVVIFYAKYFRKDLDEILNGMSAYLANDYFDNKIPRANAVVHVIIKGHVTLDELKHLVQSRWVETKDARFKNFCQYPVRWLGFTFYKKAAASFHVDNHVHLYSRQEKGIAGYVTEKDITLFSEELLNSAFTPLKSPWEVHLIQNYKNEKISSDSGQLSVFVFRMHHSLADGFGVMAAFVQAFSQQTLSDLKIPKPRYQTKTWWKKLTRCILLSLRLFMECGRVLIQTLRSYPWKVPDEKKQWHQISFRSELIPVQKLNKIRSTLGISFSSIMYSAVSAGIQQSFHDSMDILRKQILDIKQKNFEDSSIYCLHVMPLPGHPMSLTNHVTLTFLNLPIRKYDNPVARLDDVDLVLKSERETACLPWILPWFIHVVGWNVYPILKFILKNRMAPVGVTNFPMDPVHFEINGKKAIAADCIPGALEGVIGVAVMLMSYGEYIRVSATAEKALMEREDINRFGKYIVDEIERLFLIACSAGK